MISRQRACVSFVVLVTFALSAPAVRAQQTSPPNAALLYDQMTTAMQQVSNFHIQVSSAALPSGPRQVLSEVDTGSADISAQQQVFHAVYFQSITSLRTHTVVFKHRTESVAVDGRFAQRESGSTWSCQTLQPEFWQGQHTVFVILPVTPHFIGGVGSATVRGVSVWRVTLDLGNRTDVLTIAKDTSRLVRVTEVRGVKTAADGQHKTFTDFSRYGEPVATQLPRACR